MVSKSMKLRNQLKLAAISTIIATTAFGLSGVTASEIGEEELDQNQTFEIGEEELDQNRTFEIGEEELDQNQILAVAIPGRFYNLVVIEQIPEKEDCWREIGSQPTVIDPLWTTFDFTGICRRATDSNGYSVRLDGQDTSQHYSLDVVEKNGEVQLIAISREDRSRTVIGKTFGKAEGQFMKIHLNPGWEFTKKTVDEKVLGHFFLSGDSIEIAAAGDNPPAPPPVPVVNTPVPVVNTPVSVVNTSVPVVNTASFNDTRGDIYQEEIEQAVALGFIAGFNDNTFRPEQSLTREQIVSMVIGALGTIPDLQVQAPSSTNIRPYPDVAASRWSAAKIQWAKDNQIVKGYPDGSFRPEKPVTRAELMAVLESTAKYVKAQRGQTAELNLTATPTTFTDISSHWGKILIPKMSAFCGVASPYNERGNSFFPDTASSRNYAAAAAVRMQKCLINPTQQASLEQ